jgi:nitric oxide synthase oxygenase domain/subunit
MEYLELYYSERTDEMERKSIAGFVSKEERMAMVKTSIQETGTYEHTFDELEHGARVAWRNAPKCSNRKYWQQLKLLDARDVSSNEGMYSACMAHLAKAMACGSSEAYVTVFRPVTPGKDDGPQIWNDQLLSYAAYRKPISIDAFAERRHSFVGEEILGDPKNVSISLQIVQL